MRTYHVNFEAILPISSKITELTCHFIIPFHIVDGWLTKEVKEENSVGIEEFGKDLMEGGIRAENVTI